MQHPQLALALVTVRARGLLARVQHARRRHAALLMAAGAMNALHARTQAAFFERVLFTTASHTHPLLTAAPGYVTDLTTDNVLDVALASVSVPLRDYHLNRAAASSKITILFLHQGRIIPSWLDKFAPWRGLSARACSRLLLVYPSPDFVRGLPGGAVLTRDDFQRFVHEPERRIARWWMPRGRAMCSGAPLCVTLRAARWRLERARSLEWVTPQCAAAAHRAGSREACKNRVAAEV